MKLNKEKLLKTEFGCSLKKCITAWDKALAERTKYSYRKDESREYMKATEISNRCQTQWEVYQMAIKQFYGIECCFSRTDQYYGICTYDESDWLIKIER